MLEVLLVYALMHLAFRSFMKFTPWGRAEMEADLNFSPGVVMILASVFMLFATGRRAGDWGLSLLRPRADLNVAIASLGVLVFVGAIATTLGLAMRPPHLGAASAAITVLLTLSATGVILLLLRRWPLLERVHAGVGAACAAIVLAAPFVAAALRGAAAGPVALAFAWRIIGAGVGEEVFFRGYVQSRLNAAFGRPWQVLGVRFGMGLVIASLLFGLIHALNTVDYFAGSYHFAWWHALTTVAMPYGLLREQTGGVAAPAILHGLIDVLGLLAVPA